MSDSFQSIGSIAARLLDRLKPVTYAVPLDPSLANVLARYALEQGKKPETIIAEATRAYLGDAA
jgi:hypothetical protein